MSILDSLKDLYAREPARVNAVIAALIVTLATLFGLVIDATAVTSVVGAVLGLLLVSEGTRSQVASPATQAAYTPDDPDADQPRPASPLGP